MGPVAPSASASCDVMTPTPCSRPRQIGWLVISTSYSSSRGGMRSSRRSTSSRQPSGRSAARPPDADEVVVHPQAGDLLEEAQHLLPLAPAVEHHRHRRHVHAVGAEEQQVRRDPVQLGQQHADPRGPGRQLDAEQLLGGHGEDQLVEERRQVVHAGDVGAALDVREVLGRLLHAGVEVADDRLAAQHGLALQLEHEAQHAVGGRVLRPEVDDHAVVVGGQSVLAAVVAARRGRPPRPRSCAARRRPRA